MRLKNFLLAAGGAMALGLFSTSAQAQTYVMYQGSGSTPPSTSTVFSFSLPGAVTASSGGMTTYDSTANSAIEGGFSNDNTSGTHVDSSFPVLNPATGFSVNLDLQMISESHSTNDRAGFDFIVLGSDGKGVELGFWSNDVWAQQISGTTFSHDPTQDADTQGGATFASTFSTEHASPDDYVLTILGGNYSLSDNGATILTGTTHDYSGAGILPYTTTNYVFIGDDTTSAAGKEAFSLLSVTVPEPATAGGLLAIGLAGLAHRRRR